MDNAADESWGLLLSFLPFGWEEQAVLCGAVERLRGFDSTGDLLRVLLMHVGKGYSLRETAVRARRSGLAKVSDVALLLRLRKVQRWWRQLCLGLLQESGWSVGRRSAPLEPAGGGWHVGAGTGPDRRAVAYPL